MLFCGVEMWRMWTTCHITATARCRTTPRANCLIGDGILTMCVRGRWPNHVTILTHHATLQSWDCEFLKFHLVLALWGLKMVTIFQKQLIKMLLCILQIIWLDGESHTLRIKDDPNMSQFSVRTITIAINWRQSLSMASQGAEFFGNPSF